MSVETKYLVKQMACIAATAATIVSLVVSFR